MLGNCINLSNVINFETLILHRWPGAKISDIAAMVSKSILPVYEYKGHIVNDHGHEVPMYSIDVDIRILPTGKTANLNTLKAIVFDFRDVVRIEEENPIFRLTKICVEKTVNSNGHELQIADKLNQFLEEIKLSNDATKLYIDSQLGGFAKDRPGGISSTLKWSRGAITQPEAAKLCGVKLRIIQYWDSGERQPRGLFYPGRSSILAFGRFSVAYRENRLDNRNKRAIDRPLSLDEMGREKHANNGASEDDDD